MFWTIIAIALFIDIWFASAIYWLLAIYPEQVDELPNWYTKHICDDGPRIVIAQQAEHRER